MKNPSVAPVSGGKPSQISLQNYQIWPITTSDLQLEQSQCGMPWASLSVSPHSALWGLLLSCAWLPQESLSVQHSSWHQPTGGKNTQRLQGNNAKMPTSFSFFWSNTAWQHHAHFWSIPQMTLMCVNYTQLMPKPSPTLLQDHCFQASLEGNTTH